MRRVIVVALVAVAAAVALVGPSAGAKPKPVKPGQFVTYTCASGETAGSGTVAWLDKDNQVISITQATTSGATLTAGPAPDRAKAYEWRSVICIPPTTTTTVAATTTTVAPTTTTVEPTTTTAEPTTTSSTTTTTVAPTTTTLPGNVFTGTVTLPADGDVPTIWGGFGTAPKCPAGTRVDWAASTVDAPADVQVVFFPELNDSVVLFMPADPTPDGNDWFTRTISYRIVCV
jgi:hypothetical protein